MRGPPWVRGIRWLLTGRFLRRSPHRALSVWAQSLYGERMTSKPLSAAMSAMLVPVVAALTLVNAKSASAASLDEAVESAMQPLAAGLSAVVFPGSFSGWPLLPRSSLSTWVSSISAASALRSVWCAGIFTILRRRGKSRTSRLSLRQCREQWVSAILAALRWPLPSAAQVPRSGWLSQAFYRCLRSSWSAHSA